MGSSFLGSSKETYACRRQFSSHQFRTRTLIKASFYKKDIAKLALTLQRHVLDRQLQPILQTFFKHYSVVSGQKCDTGVSR